MLLPDSCALLAAHCRLLDATTTANCWLPVSRCWPAAGLLLGAGCHPLVTVGYLLLVHGYLLLIVGSWFLIADYCLLTAGR